MFGDWEYLTTYDHGNQPELGLSRAMFVCKGVVDDRLYVHLECSCETESNDETEIGESLLDIIEMIVE